MDFFDSTKSLIENIYFVSGPLLVVLGLVIFRQIKLAKDQIVIAKSQLEESQKQAKINSQRQAATLSADLVKDYINSILPMENKLYFETKDVKYPNSKIEVKNFTNDEVISWDKEFWNKYKARPENIMMIELEVINRLEAFSVYFIKGIADEKVAFASIGKSFCRSVEDNYATITLLRGSKNPNRHYDNLVELYKCWKQRLDNSMIDFEKEAISSEIKEKILKLEQLKNQQQPSEVIKPIGT